MNLKRLTFYITLTILVIFTAGLVLFSSFVIFGPGYIGRKVIPEIAEKAGINIISLSIRNIGLNGAVLSDIEIGQKKQSGLTIDSVRIDYSLSGLLKRTVDRITISGAGINVEYKNGSAVIKGFEGLTAGSPVKNGEQKDLKGFTVKDLETVNSAVRINYNGRYVTVPFSASCSSFSSSKLPESANAVLFPGEKEIKANVRISGNSGGILSVSSGNFPVSLFRELVKDTSIDIKGRTDIKLSLKFMLKTLSFSDISASVLLDDFELNHPSLSLKTPDSERPVKILIESADSIKWKYSFSPVLVSGLSQGMETGSAGGIEFEGDSLKGRIKAETLFVSDQKIPGMEWVISFTGKKDAPFVMQVKGVSAGSEIPVKLPFKTYSLTVDAMSPEIEAYMEYGANGLVSEYKVSMKGIEARKKDLNFSMSGVSVKGKAWYPAEKDNLPGSSFSVKCDVVKYKDSEITAGFPEPAVNGTVKYISGKGMDIDGSLIFKNGSISQGDSSYEVTGISGTIPVAWPFNKKRDGTLFIEKLAGGGFTAGPFNGEIKQGGTSVSLNGRLTWPLFPEMEILFTALTSTDAPFEQGRVHIRVPVFEPAKDFDPGKLSPGLKGTFIKGKFNMDSDIDITSSGITAKAFMGIGGGRFEHSGEDLLFENISCHLLMEDIFSMRSFPGQKLSIEKITRGDIIAGDVSIGFRIDPGFSIFVEQGGFKWAGGNISTQSFRIDPRKEEYDITLFCDRLNLAQVLNQFGVASTTGEGTVNGKIPLRYSEGELSFRDGFLYSTPGSGGRIRLTDTSILSSGLKPGSAQYTQIDIAREALKDFDYSWVKLHLNSEENNLLMQLQFDGKPANKLPFVFNKNDGSFLRIEGEGEGSVFQGLRLDVNLRMPLDDILNYRGIFDMIK